MTPETWERVQRIFTAALERPPEARAEFIEDACRGDAELRKEVESLLTSHDDETSGFLESPAIATAAPPGPGRLGRGTRLGSNPGFQALLKKHDGP